MIIPLPPGSLLPAERLIYLLEPVHYRYPLRAFLLALSAPDAVACTVLLTEEIVVGYPRSFHVVVHHTVIIYREIPRYGHIIGAWHTVFAARAGYCRPFHVLPSHLF